MKNFFLTLLAFASLFSLSAQDKTIVEIAMESDDFNTLVTAVKAADLVETLSGEGTFTVFAPTDAAFEKLPEGLVAALVKPENKTTLQQILTYHVVGTKLPASAVVDGIKGNSGKLKVNTVAGSSFEVMMWDGNVVIKDAQGNKSKVVTTDIMASNGVIHVIDAVILPQNVNPGDLLAANVTKTNVRAAANRSSQTQGSIASVAMESDQLTTLVAAAKAADLVDFLSNGNGITVFAPTDEAFGELPDGTVETLTRPENKKKLQQILSYHVVNAPIDANTLKRGIAREGGYYVFNTVAGYSLVATIQNGKVKISDGNGNSFYVIQADVEAGNGYVHLIDGVMLPSKRFVAEQ